MFARALRRRKQNRTRPTRTWHARPRETHPAELSSPSAGQDVGPSARLLPAPILLLFDDRIAPAPSFSLKRAHRHDSSVIAANAFTVWSSAGGGCGADGTSGGFGSR